VNFKVSWGVHVDPLGPRKEVEFYVFWAKFFISADHDDPNEY